MSTPTYCLLNYTSVCYSISDWNSIAVIFATYTAVPGILFAAYKTWREFKKNRQEHEAENQQRDREHLLKRIEFTLAQHRRLFDDPVLYNVLSLIDSDDSKLSEFTMWDPKRKLLTFFEEIALLVNSKQINDEVAYYMFGYYAKCARDGANFQVGIDLEEKYWGLFFNFSENAENYLNSLEVKNIQNLKL